MLPGGNFARGERLPELPEGRGLVRRAGTATGLSKLYDAGGAVRGRFILWNPGAQPRGRGQGAASLGRAAFLETCTAGHRMSGPVHRDRVLETVQNLVGRVLQAGVGLVQLAGRLGGELAQLIAVGDVGEG